jgi:hypothetical protein
LGIAIVCGNYEATPDVFANWIVESWTGNFDLRASNAAWRHLVVVDDHCIRIRLPGLVSNSEAIRGTEVLWPINCVHKWQTSVSDRPS